MELAMGVGDHFAQGGPQIIGRLINMGGVPTDCREYIWELLAQLDRAPAALQICADGDNLRNARGVSTLDYPGQILRKVREIEMGVGIVKMSHHAHVTFPFGSCKRMLRKKDMPFSKPSFAVIRLSSCSMERTAS